MGAVIYARVLCTSSHLIVSLISIIDTVTYDVIIHTVKNVAEEVASVVRDDAAEDCLLPPLLLLLMEKVKRVHSTVEAADSSSC